jgi:hypothetical protein
VWRCVSAGQAPVPRARILVYTVQQVRLQARPTHLATPILILFLSTTNLTWRVRIDHELAILPFRLFNDLTGVGEVGFSFENEALD